VSHVPASRPITSRPARASGNAATPPAAPRPMMTTSVSLSLVAMMRIVSGGRARRRLGEHLVVVRGLVVPCRAWSEPLVVRRDDGADAGIANEIPADEGGVATVKGIAEGTLERVGADHREKRGRGLARIR